MRCFILQPQETSSAADEQYGYGELSERAVHGCMFGNSFRLSLFSGDSTTWLLGSLNDSRSAIITPSNVLCSELLAIPPVEHSITRPCQPEAVCVWEVARAAPLAETGCPIR
jgi:hypothetical protein